MMKKLALAILIALGANGAQAAVELKLGHFASDTHPCGIAAKDFKANVEKRTNGEVKIALYGNNVLGSPPEELEQVLLGAVDMSLSGQDQLAKHLPFYDVISTPFAFKDYATADKIIDGDFKTWAAPELLKKNLVHLSDWEWGFRQLTNSKKPILTPADMKGMKIRTPPAFAYQAFVEAAGGNAVTIAFSELVMAMKQGVVDGQENPLMNIWSSKLYEVQKYISLTAHKYEMTPFLIGKRSWDKLSDADKKVIQEAAVEATALQRKLAQEADEKSLADLKAKGVQIDKVDQGPFMKATAPVLTKWEAGPIGPFVKKVAAAARAK